MKMTIEKWGLVVGVIGAVAAVVAAAGTLFVERDRLGWTVPVQVTYETDKDHRAIIIVNKGQAELTQLVCKVVNAAGKNEKIYESPSLPAGGTLVIANYDDPRRSSQDPQIKMLPDFDATFNRSWEFADLDAIGENDSFQISADSNWSKIVSVKDASK
jgi:hypothetical protein